MHLRFAHHGRQFFFFTICVEGRRAVLSRLVEGAKRPELTRAGECVKALWLAIHGLNPALTAGEFIIMPDHVHLLLIVNYDRDPAFKPLVFLHWFMEESARMIAAGAGAGAATDGGFAPEPLLPTAIRSTYRPPPPSAAPMPGGGSCAMPTSGGSGVPPFASMPGRGSCAAPSAMPGGGSCAMPTGGGSGVQPFASMPTRGPCAAPSAMPGGGSCAMPTSGGSGMPPFASMPGCGSCAMPTSGGSGAQPPSVAFQWEHRFWLDLSFDARQLAAIRRYIRGNPARALWKRQHPDRFACHVNLRHRILDPAFSWSACGELTLLASPFLLAVSLTRKKSLAEHEAEIAALVEKARKGWVIVCGFLSPGEKELARRLREAPQTRWIKTLAQGLPPRYDPSLADSRELAAGRLLILSALPCGAPFDWNTCHQMNALAAAMCRRARGENE